MWAGGGLYDRWVAFLQRWGAGESTDPASLPPLRKEDLPGDGWERLVNRLCTAISLRLQSWADALTRAVAESRDEFEVGRALGQGRGDLRQIRALAGHPGLPADVRDRLVDMVDRQIRSVQQGLDDQVGDMRRAGVDRRAVEARLRTVRDNPLTVLVGDDPASSERGGVALWSVDPSAPSRRRVIRP